MLRFDSKMSSVAKIPFKGKMQAKSSLLLKRRSKPQMEAHLCRSSLRGNQCVYLVSLQNTGRGYLQGCGCSFPRRTHLKGLTQ